MSTPCLRCGKPLEEEQVDTVPVRFCRECKGMLMKHSDLIQVLEQSWRLVPEKEALQKQFHVAQVQNAEPVFACPDCTQSMEEYGYMGWAAIPLHRCDRCSLVWLDSDELQNMVLALAKSHCRGARMLQRDKESFDLADLGIHAAAVPSRSQWLYDKEGADPEDDPLNEPKDQILALAQSLLTLLFRA